MNIFYCITEILIFIILLPFFIYVYSKMQMIGWLAGIDFYETFKGEKKWQKNQK